MKNKNITRIDRRKGLAVLAVTAVLCLVAAGCGEREVSSGAARQQESGQSEAGLETSSGAASQQESGQTEAGGQTSFGAAPQQESGRSEAERQMSSGNVPQQSGLPDGDTGQPGAGAFRGRGTPVYGSQLRDGVYSIAVDSSSTMFRITECKLAVKDGQMEAVMTMGGTGYLKLYMGTGAEAETADPSGFIPYQEQADGSHTFTVPVEALDQEIPCSAFSRKKEIWYDRVLVFKSDALPEEAFVNRKSVTAESLGLSDGVYLADVVLAGGSGRASVESPARIEVAAGTAMAVIVWGSSNYDYMIVDGEKITREGTEGNSSFRIPLAAFDREIPVIADTTAMGTPHEVEYTLFFDSASLREADGTDQPGRVSAGQPGAGGTGQSMAGKSGQSGRGSVGQPIAGKAGQSEAGAFHPAVSSRISRDWKDRKATGYMNLRYASQFFVEYYEDGSALAAIQDVGQYLVVPEDGQIPRGLPEEVTVIRQPLNHIYLAATSAMDLFRSLDGIGQVTLSGTDASGWYIPEARQAMEAGNMVYAGKYSAPDYERILAEGCDLAIESTMIFHTPEVKEQLERLGIPVLVERSSYESHPLGRLEWLKLYGLLLGKEALAEGIVEQCLGRLEPVLGQEPAGKTVAWFYITSNGAVNVRKSGDYMARLIGLAGGTYIPGDLDETGNAQSTMNIQMEAFYQAARDADYLIYSGSIHQAPASLKEFLDKSPLLEDFRAVKEGHVWCTDKDFFQETMGLGDMLLDLNRMLTREDMDPSGMTYLRHLR